MPHAAPAPTTRGALSLASSVTATRAELLHTITLTALRVIAGLMLAQHGLQKLFGLLLAPDREWGGAPAILSQPWIAGVLEVGGGVLLAIGLFTRPVAFVLSGLMAAAYFLAHAPRGFWPVLNRGELPALYCFVFLMFAVVGGGPYSLDAVLARRRRASAG